MGSILPIIEILLPIVNSVLNKSVTSGLPQEVITAAIAVVKAVEELHNTAVTKAQLESLRG